ncbi:thiamine pyrophosphate-dependent enzyme [Billgrantia desiderata]|uniref:thiamine pyrophosphate-dependent enzyme n=1 Tax=Billgrantia desiderata TaxID=52021 RepID=UPI001F2AB696|nr:thiamine pyrophosphate-dependent enzyme [Halomonas desiderata]
MSAVVLHNRQWGADKKNLAELYNRCFLAGELHNQSFAEIGLAIGAKGITVGRVGDVDSALKKTVQMNEGNTCIIEVICT